MQALSHRGKHWRRILRKHGGLLYLCVGVFFILLLVGGLMYMLSSPDFRVRP